MLRLRNVFLLILGVAFAGCGESFVSKRPWENPPVFGQVRGADADKLIALINPFPPGKALDSYYVEKIILKDEQNGRDLAIFESDQGKVFHFGKEEENANGLQEGNGLWEIKQDKQGVFLKLEYYSGEMVEVRADNNGGFQADGLPLIKSLSLVGELKELNRFCVLNMKSAGRTLRNLEGLNQDQRRERGEEFKACVNMAREYIDLSRSPNNDKIVCRNLAKKYRQPLKKCN